MLETEAFVLKTQAFRQAMILGVLGGLVLPWPSLADARWQLLESDRDFGGIFPYVAGISCMVRRRSGVMPYCFFGFVRACFRTCGLERV